jgi:hypothetical protein
MGVIYFLCISLGSSTVQLHDSLSTRRPCARSEHSFVVKMATVFEECTTEEQLSVVVPFCGQKNSMQRIFIKKCFLFAVGSLCRVSASQLCGKRYADIEEFETEVRKWLRQQSKRLLSCTSVSMLVEDMSRNKCFFPVRISHVLICSQFTECPSYT